ncbi:hypothetical protein H4R19_000330 [Coemansia spiralis]|nr:hypothetical protein H4R19_000330 [Coemansia spiralis]
MDGTGELPEAAPAAGLLGDFGLIDYESPAPDTEQDGQGEELEEELEPDHSADSMALDPPPSDGAAEHNDNGILDYAGPEARDDSPVPTPLAEADEALDMEQHAEAADYDEDGGQEPEEALDMEYHAETAGYVEDGVLDYAGPEARDDSPVPTPPAEADEALDMEYHAEAADYVEDGGQEPEVAPAGMPETWVYTDGEWMLYLGPEQHSYTTDYQETLFQMPLSDLISVLQSDFALDEGVDLALEFPSLALTIDQRDEQCGQVSLFGLYSGHVAVVELGRLPLAYASSQYFSPAASSFCPSPASFSFILHTRPNVQAALQRVMDAATEHAQAAAVVDAPEAITEAITEVADVEPANGDVAVDDEEQLVDVDHMDESVEGPGDDADGDEDGDAEEHESVGSSTAALLDNVDEEEEDDDEDDDFVAEDNPEEEGDHILSDDAVEEDEVEIVDDYEEDDGEQTSVGSGGASPRNKRTKNQQVAAGPDAADEDEADEPPASKRARSDDDGEAEQPVAA